MKVYLYMPVYFQVNQNDAAARLLFRLLDALLRDVY